MISYVKQACRCRGTALLVAVLLGAGCSNRPPSDPLLMGPESGQPGETLVFGVWSVDPAADEIAYRFNWGDNEEKGWTPFVQSDDTFRRRHCFDEPGLYPVTARSRNRKGLESGPSLPLRVRIAIAGPYPVGLPTGPDSTFPDTFAHFAALAGHVRGESVSVQFDWHGTAGDWTSVVAAGTTARDSQRFAELGDYLIRFRARDHHGNVSTWSAPTGLAVRMRPLEAPRDLTLSTGNGENVILCWDTGTNPDSTRYGLWFRPADLTEFKLTRVVTGRAVEHEPGGVTGCYTVSASLGEQERFAAETLSTLPVFTDTLLLRELNADGRSGYGWDTNGRARLLAMTDTASAAHADLYFTDRNPGSHGPVFFLSSPHLGPEDPGGGVPEAPWRRTGLALLWTPPREPLPPYDSLVYSDLVDVSLMDNWLAVYTADGHYALVNSFDPEPESARVRLRSWYQPVRGLRLVEQEGSPEPSRWRR